jgi:hypothetical protein
MSSEIEKNDPLQTLSFIYNQADEPTVIFLENKFHEFSNQQHNIRLSRGLEASTDIAILILSNQTFKSTAVVTAVVSAVESKIPIMVVVETEDYDAAQSTTFLESREL